MKFTVVADDDYPRTYFVGGQQLRLAAGDEYETEDAGLIAALKDHGQFKQVKAAKSEKAAKD